MWPHPQWREAGAHFSSWAKGTVVGDRLEEDEESRNWWTLTRLCPRRCPLVRTCCGHVLGNSRTLPVLTPRHHRVYINAFLTWTGKHALSQIHVAFQFNHPCNKGILFKLTSSVLLELPVAPCNEIFFYVLTDPHKVHYGTCSGWKSSSPIFV